MYFQPFGLIFLLVQWARAGLSRFAICKWFFTIGVSFVRIICGQSYKDSIVVIYDHRGFIRLATGCHIYACKLGPIQYFFFVIYSNMAVTFWRYPFTVNFLGQNLAGFTNPLRFWNSHQRSLNILKCRRDEVKLVQLLHDVCKLEDERLVRHVHQLGHDLYVVVSSPLNIEVLQELRHANLGPNQQNFFLEILSSWSPLDVLLESFS